MANIETFTCEVCGKDWQRTLRGGVKPKSCSEECRKKYHSLYMEEYRKTYNKENRERIRAKDRSRYAENREEILAKNRAWRQANREKIAARWAAQYVPIISSAECVVCGENFTYHKKGSERLYCSEPCVQAAKLGARKRWRDKNRNLYASYAASRRAKMKSRMVEFVEKDVLLERDGWTCHICKGEIPKGLDWKHPLFPHVDHIVPLSKGGEHSYENTASAHASCNIQKKDKLDGWQDIKPYVPEGGER